VKLAALCVEEDPALFGGLLDDIVEALLLVGKIELRSSF
jgi:hypothetical protein